MAKNKVYERGQKIALPVAVGVVSGDPVVVGDEGLSGVALIDRQSNGEATVDFEGVFDLEIVAGAAMAIGDEVVITAATGVLSDAAVGAGVFKFGYVLEVIAGASTVTVAVKLER